MRKNSFAIEGGSFGDEGKGKIVDELASRLVKNFEKIIVYRWNGGANAGHTVIVNGQKIILHNIPSGALTKGATAILGKGMVIHPMDLLQELFDIVEKFGLPSRLLVDEMAVVSLDTHRAFESALKRWASGGKGSTGRGIAPSYADVLLRHPLRMRDLKSENWKEKFEKHYLLYEGLVAGLGQSLSDSEVVTLTGKIKRVGNLNSFLSQIEFIRPLLLPFIENVSTLLKENWEGDTPFIFEGAQGVGLDPRWGVYPDVTSSDVSFSGVLHSTEGLINSDDIEYKIAVYKATYMSSVGSRILPSKMNGALANKIRKDANEYGATTGRPRDIYHIDLPALTYFKRVSGATHMVLTHLDVSYKKTPVKACTTYKLGEKEIEYKPDQEFLNRVKPIYKTYKTWDGEKVLGQKKLKDLPASAREFIKKIGKDLGLKPFMVSTGPERDDLILLAKGI